MPLFRNTASIALLISTLAPAFQAQASTPDTAAHLAHLLRTGPFIAEMARLGSGSTDLHLVGERFGTQPGALQVLVNGKAVPFKLLNDAHLVLPMPRDAPATTQITLLREGRMSLPCSLGSPVTVDHPRSLILMTSDYPLFQIEGNVFTPYEKGFRTRTDRSVFRLTTLNYNRMVVQAFDLTPDDLHKARGNGLPPDYNYR